MHLRKRLNLLFNFLTLMSAALCFTPPAAAKVSCNALAGTLPMANEKPGTVNKAIPIEHIIVLMQENHSFDNYFGRLNQAKYYGSEINGVTNQLENETAQGKKIFAHHETSLCVSDPEHDWDAIHTEWNHGKMDGFVQVNDAKAMGYFDQRDIPFYYDLANKFAVADNYFCSSLTQTFPNRFYLYAGTSFGHVANDVPTPVVGFDQKTIFDAMNKYGVSWKYYKDGLGYLTLFQPLYLANYDKMAPIADFANDLKNGQLPEVMFIDAGWDGQDEHPNANIQDGQLFVAQRVSELMQSPYWDRSVLFLTYDEGGGFFDHVSPPQACEPDDIEPNLAADDAEPGRFDNLGVRVPFVAVSPFAKHHFVSHEVYDHTSILKFIETKFNLPALSKRDANAVWPQEMFDFANPHPEIKPDPSLAQVTQQCE